MSDQTGSKVKEQVSHAVEAGRAKLEQRFQNLASAENQEAVRKTLHDVRSNAVKANRWYWSDTPIDWITTRMTKISLAAINANTKVAEGDLAAAEQELARLETALGEEHSRTKRVLSARRAWRSQVDAEFRQRAERHLAGQTLDLWGGWGDPRWQGWAPQPDRRLPVLRIGSEKRLITRPVALPFIGKDCTVVIQYSGKTEELARSGVLQSLILRIALSMPLDVRFTLLDPVTLDGAFPLRGQLPNVRPYTDDILAELRAVSADIQRVRSSVVEHHASFEAVPPEARAGEVYECIFLAGLGERSAGERRVLESLQSIGENGPACGRYLFMLYRKGTKLVDFSLDKIRNVMVVDLDETEVQFDPIPPPDTVRDLLDRARRLERPKAVVSWNTTAGLPEERWWTHSAVQEIATFVGDRKAELWLGERKEVGSCVHGILAGTAGSGKSKLLHSMIAGLCQRYSPNELQLFLVDGKSGVEFQRYAGLPHSRVVSLLTAPIFAHAVLEEVYGEMQARFKRFNEESLASYSEYRQRHPNTILPRLLLIVDEYQQLFAKDAVRASHLLAEISSLGRAAGVHFFLASQKFNAQGMLQVETIFKNIHLRVALKTSDPAGINEFGPKSKRLIQELDRPGVAVVNTQAGADNASVRCNVVAIPDDDSLDVLARLRTRAEADPCLRTLPPPVVFNGSDQPPPSANRTLRDLLRRPARPNAGEMQEIAQRPARQGGLGLDNWLAAEQPVALWLGQAFAVYGHQAVALRRASQENLIIVGDALPRHGMLAGSLAGLAALFAPGGLRLRAIDASIPGTPGSGALEMVCDSLLRQLGHDVVVEHNPAAVEMALEEFTAELARRQADPRLIGESKPWLLVISEPDRMPLLRRDGASRAPQPISDRLRTLLRLGSEAGLHVVVSMSNYRGFGQFLDERRDLTNFNHRIALQMSDVDSRAFIASGAAGMLGHIGSGISAVYANIAQGPTGVSYFKPYCLVEPEALVAELAALRADLTRG